MSTQREVALEIERGGIILRSETGTGGRGTSMEGGGAGATGGGVEREVGIDLHLRLETDHLTTALSDKRHHQCTSKLII